MNTLLNIIFIIIFVYVVVDTIRTNRKTDRFLKDARRDLQNAVKALSYIDKNQSDLTDKHNNLVCLVKNFTIMQGYNVVKDCNPKDPTFEKIKKTTKK